jgi:hypothetical protein
METIIEALEFLTGKYPNLSVYMRHNASLSQIDGVATESFRAALLNRDSETVAACESNSVQGAVDGVIETMESK